MNRPHPAIQFQHCPRVRATPFAQHLRSLGAIMSIAVGIFALGGCATSQQATHSPQSASPAAHAVPLSTTHTDSARSQGLGDSWAVVLPTPAVEPALEFAASDRLDDTLRPDDRGRLATATDQWPRPDRPTLDRPFFVRTTGSRSTGFIYYRSDHRSHNHTRRHWYP